jgi:hypothetical protein
MSRFKAHFIRHLGETNASADVFGDITGAAAAWPFDSDFYATGDTRLPTGGRKGKKDRETNTKNKSKFVHYELIPLQRRNLNSTM